MRIAVTGSRGQVATSLLERAGPEIEIVTLSRPDVALEDRDSILAAVASAQPDVIINAAAYTAVDKAESEEELAMRVNGAGAGFVAEAAAAIARRFSTCRPTMSSTAGSNGLTARTIRLPRRAPTGARSSQAKSGSPSIARTASCSGPPGSTARLARISSAPCCVSTRRAMKSAWSPTSAAARPRRSTSRTPCIAVARRIRADDAPELRGVFHLTGAGEATWADLAEAVFAEAHARGRRLTRVKRITTAEYPTPARRPANSRLDNAKLRRVYGLALPDWRISVAGCCARLIP